MLLCQQIKKLDAGEEFSLCLTETGRVLSWGRYNSNVLGHGEDGHLHIPLIIAAIEELNIIDIAAGASHCLALTDNGTVYSWGNNEEGQLGLGHKNAVITPMLVEHLVNKNIRQISAGSSHSAAWTSETSDNTSLSMALPTLIPKEYNSLQKCSLKEITHRLSVLQYSSELILKNLHYCNFSQMGKSLGIEEIPKFILSKPKQTVFRRQLSKTAYLEGDTTIQLDDCLKDIFTAIFLQLSTLEPKELRASFRPYKIRYDGNLIEDYDEFHEDLISQLEDGIAGLLVPTPNNILKIGLNQDNY